MILFITSNIPTKHSILFKANMIFSIVISNTQSFVSNIHTLIANTLSFVVTWNLARPCIRKTRNGIEFVPRVRIQFFYTKQKQAITDHLLHRYNSQDKIFLRIDYIIVSRGDSSTNYDYMYHKISAECLVIGFAYLHTYIHTIY